MKFSKFPIGSEVVVTEQIYGEEEVGTKGVIIACDQKDRALVEFPGNGGCNTWYFSDGGEDGSIKLVAKKKEKPVGEFFWVGDAVISSGDNYTESLIGTVVEVGASMCLVQFPSWNKGHNGDTSDGSTDKWWVDNEHLSKVCVEKKNEKKKKAPKGKQEYKGNGKHSWETVVDTVSRLRVPGGWLYRDDRNMATVFVPVPQAVGYAV
jgi:hypothetical protein